MAAGDFNLGSNIDLHGNQILNGKWQVLSSAPGSPFAWQIYNNSSDGKTYMRNGANSAWIDISAPTGYIKADGSVDFTGDQSMDGHKITDIGFPLADGDAANRIYVDNRNIVVKTLAPNGTNPATIGNGAVVNGYTLSTGDFFACLLDSNLEYGIYLVSASSSLLEYVPFSFSVEAGNSAGLMSVINKAGTAYFIVSPAETATTLGNLTNGLTAKSTAVDADMLPLMDSAASNIWKKLSLSNLWTYIVSKLTTANYLTNSSTHVLTNKTFDANGAGNAISNIETADFATSVIDTDVALTANSDTRLATQKAVKAYAAPETVATIGSVTTSASAKTSLVDADTIPLNDSAASNALKKITVANVKAWLLTVPLLGWTLGSNATISASDTITGAFGKIQAQLNAVGANVLAQVLTGYTTGSNAVISATNSVLTAFQDLQAQITGYAASARTFTNKGIDAATNTISNLATSMFASGVIDNDNTLAANSATKIATQQATKGYIDNTVQAMKWKKNARLATTGAETFTISGGAVTGINGTVVDGVSPAINDEILIKNAPASTGVGSGTNTTQSANGLYIVTGNTTNLTLIRSTQADTAVEIKGMIVPVDEGTVNADTAWHMITDAAITLNTTALTFNNFNLASSPAATTAIAGKVFLATLAEAEAKSDATKAVVSADLANFLLGKSSAFLIGNGSATSFNLTHSFGKKIKSCKIRKVSDGSNWGDCGYDSSTSVYVVNFGAYVPTTNEFEVELAA